MIARILHGKDFWAALMFIGLGAASAIIGRDYAVGTAMRMGPGYFPAMLGGILAVFGLYFLARALHSPVAIERGWPWRALIVLPLSLVLFGLLMDHAGFVPALFVLVFGSAAAGNEFRLVEVLLLATFLTAFAVVLFVWGLGLPYPLIVGL
jgi:putative tricarboxylic transport membrane protein